MGEVLIDSVERRRHRRYELPLSVDLYDEARKELLARNVRIQDISRSGFCFETVAEQFSPGEVLRFSIELPRKGSVEGRVRVCWRHNEKRDVLCMCGAGIQSMGWLQAHRLKRYLEPVSISVMRLTRLTGGVIIGLIAAMAAESYLRGAWYFFERVFILLENPGLWLLPFILVIGIVLLLLNYWDVDW